MTVRVYVPATLGALAQFVEEGGIGPSPVRAHAVTEWLQESWPEADEEEWAYAALMAAADDSTAMLSASAGEQPPRRLVIVAEVARVTADRESTVVSVDAAIALRLVEAVHADTEDVDPAVPEEMGDLGWFAVQEIPDLLP
jgi:hypothetical protein